MKAYLPAELRRIGEVYKNSIVESDKYDRALRKIVSDAFSSKNESKCGRVAESDKYSTALRKIVSDAFGVNEAAEGADFVPNSEIINKLKKPALDAAQERKMIEEYMSQGKRDELNWELVYHNTGLIMKFVKKYYLAYNKDIDELVSIGVTALHDAAEKFDISKNIKFSTFAPYVLSNAFRDQFKTHVGKVALNSDSLDEPIKNSHGDDSDRATVGDMIEDPRDGMGEYENRDSYSRFKELLDVAHLTDREKKFLIECRINGKRLEELGNMYGCSKQRVNQIVRSAEMKVRKTILGNFTSVSDFFAHPEKLRMPGGRKIAF